MGIPSSEEVVYDATLNAITRTRQVLLVVSALIGLGFFTLYQWYGSWQHARVDARIAVASAVEQINSSGSLHGASRQLDQELIESMRAEAGAIRSAMANATFDVPLIGVTVSTADFPTGLLMVATGVMLWLYFYLRRLNECLDRLNRISGWGVVKPVLEYHFTLIGTHASPTMRRAAAGLILGLPAFAILTLLSDVYDLYSIWSDPTQGLAFSSADYVIRVAVRLLVDFVLICAVTIAGWSSFKQQQAAEDTLLQFAPGAGESEIDL